MNAQELFDLVKKQELDKRESVKSEPEPIIHVGKTVEYSVRGRGDTIDMKGASLSYKDMVDAIKSINNWGYSTERQVPPIYEMGSSEPIDYYNGPPSNFTYPTKEVTPIRQVNYDTRSVGFVLKMCSACGSSYKGNSHSSSTTCFNCTPVHPIDFSSFGISPAV